jgi:hypothetical protein
MYFGVTLLFLKQESLELIRLVNEQFYEFDTIVKSYEYELLSHYPYYDFIL